MLLLMDQKISAAQIAAGETFAGINDEIAGLKKGKNIVDGSFIPESGSASVPPTQEQFYGMPPNSFPGQTPLPSSVHVTLIRPVQATGQTGQTSAMVQNPPSPMPLANIPLFGRP